jgi:hypothetical protein
MFYRRVLSDGKDGVRSSGSVMWCQMVLQEGPVRW